jgi:hypothetical protein
MKDWHCYIDNQTYGPYPENLLRELIDRGQLTADTYVYNDSPEDAPKGWQRAGDTEIATLLFNSSSNGPAFPPFQQTQINFQHTEQNNQKTRSFVGFSKKRIAVLVGSAVALIFAIAIISPVYEWLSQPSPASTPEEAPQQPLPSAVSVQAEYQNDYDAPTETPRRASLQLDLEEKRERIRYRVSSSWRKEYADDKDFWGYFPYEEEGDGAFVTYVSSFYESPVVDTDILNSGLDAIITNWLESTFHDLYLPARTDINGVPVQRFEGKGKYDNLINGFFFLYGKRVYALCVAFPETDDSQFFPSALKQVMDNLIIEKYSQAELSKIAANDSTAKPTKPSGSTPAQSVDSAYQAILDEYSKKIRVATPKLINEYRAEAAKNSDGLMGLAQISMTKVSKLAAISTEGVSEMAKIMLSSGTWKYEAYEAWSKKLMDVYTEEAQKITDAYMASVSF